MLDWGYEAMIDTNDYDDLFSGFSADTRVAAAGIFLSEDDLVTLVSSQLRGKAGSISRILYSDSVRRTNSFAHLSESAKAEAMNKIVEDQQLLQIFILRLKENYNAISSVLKCHEVEEKVTIDHACKGSSQQYSIARILSNDALLHRLTAQLWFDRKALEKILQCDAVNASNSFNYFSDSRKAAAILEIQSNPALLTMFTNELKSNTKALAKVLSCNAVKTTNSFADLSRDAMIASIGTMLNDKKLRCLLTKHLMENDEAVEDLLTCEAIRRRNTFSTLPLNAKTTVITKIIKDHDLLAAFTGQLRDQEEVIAKILNCDAVQELITIDHIGNSQCIQYSVARMLKNPALLERLTYQLRFDELATEKVLCCEAIRRQNSIVHLPDSAQANCIDYILANERLRQLLMVQLEVQDSENRPSPKKNSGKGKQQIQDSCSENVLSPRNDSRNQQGAVHSFLGDADSIVMLTKELGQEKRQAVLVQVFNAAKDRLAEISKAKPQDPEGRIMEPSLSFFM